MPADTAQAGTLFLNCPHCEWAVPSTTVQDDAAFAQIRERAAEHLAANHGLEVADAELISATLVWGPRKSAESDSDEGASRAS